MNGQEDQTYRVFQLVIKPDPDKVEPYIITWANGERIADGRMSVPSAETRRSIVSWRNEMGKDIVLEFYGQTWDKSRALKLFSHHADQVVIMNGNTTEMVVQSFADVKGSQRYPDGVTWENEHVYRIRDYPLGQPGPGIVVCPPGQQPPCQ
jgi:hypothetical protein